MSWWETVKRWWLGEPTIRIADDVAWCSCGARFTEWSNARVHSLADGHWVRDMDGMRIVYGTQP